ncbi:unnamed protein product [Mytilus edulis]|uniref:Ankyrin repeat protein n=1 Tax=Mytilus edulis TaxID=6550 RepID=A0A8S3TVT8_MYTED|nr:unnamed protein product [Mytilus edulis]
MNAEKIRLACEYGSVGIIQWCLDAISLECFDINSLMVESCGYGWINIVKRVWNHEHINHDKLDMKTAMNDACTYNRFEIVTWLLQNIDGLKFDMSNVLMESCRHGWIDSVKTVIQNGDSTLYNITSCISQACTNGHLELIEYMYKDIWAKSF